MVHISIVRLGLLCILLTYDYLCRYYYHPEEICNLQVNNWIIKVCTHVQTLSKQSCIGLYDSYCFAFLEWHYHLHICWQLPSRQTDYITSEFNPWTSYSPIVSPDLVFAYQILGIVSFVTLWIATLFLTRHYASKSKIKYWIIVSIPLIYFASLYLIAYLEHSDLLGQLGVVLTTGSESVYSIKTLKN